MVNFYHQFVPAAAQLMWPLVATFSGRAQNNALILSWTEDMLQAFNATKQALADATMLAHPQHDAPLALSMDTSDTAVGSVLKQFVSDTWQPLAFFSHML